MSYKKLIAIITTYLYTKRHNTQPNDDVIARCCTKLHQMMTFIARGSRMMKCNEFVQRKLLLKASEVYFCVCMDGEKEECAIAAYATVYVV